ncbi:hypothetical protein [Vibrio campbellii]|uniref:Transcriptional regulator VspR n=2 Tax=Vibrio campbellii TaxID=680 RepID=A7N6L7_VIBC1|nr:hypothetical protein [Vibrio campbellii]ABU74108.1 hypothetical protein VIBHAR_06216 [Vibrio campbellii ATCC BAA-1116]AGU98408.1 hypothetical protein M892_20940 [Vibrio campbellii ATCC BAA-1116]MBT0123070.1 hypothetical protein [Vibrio campbellii]MBT0138122.1 hypothetical protein [Vibrio campbellii]MBT0142860.1 hypothetical protein [Vibrio campbellii]
MTKKVQVNRDIYEIISLPSVSEFRVTQIRNLITKKSGHYSNKNTARLYVARQLESLEKQGVLKSQGLRHNKTYRKTDMFADANFILKDKRVSKKRPDNSGPLNSASVKSMLMDEKKDIESNLTIALAEINEYKLLMSRSKSLHNLLLSSHLDAVNKAAVLVAKLNVWTDAIKLVTKQDVKSC